jgi:endogenous inhibitor of DNA gyrase (YacG/DUF329 family)
MEYRCPVCHKAIKTSAKDPTTEIPFFPFCCQRCKLIDLGAWLDADYRITSKSQSDDDKNFDSFKEETGI